MIPASATSCSDFLARAGIVNNAADLVELAIAELPGPETRAGFDGPVRVAYDLSLNPAVELMRDTQHFLRGAARQFALAAVSPDALP